MENKTKILLLEPDYFKRSQLKVIFESMDYEVFEARDEWEKEKLLEAENIELVFFDEKRESA